jgi:hypothetical protein
MSFPLKDVRIVSGPSFKELDKCKIGETLVFTLKDPRDKMSGMNSCRIESKRYVDPPGHWHLSLWLMGSHSLIGTSPPVRKMVHAVYSSKVMVGWFEEDDD